MDVTVCQSTVREQPSRDAVRLMSQKARLKEGPFPTALYACWTDHVTSEGVNRLKVEKTRSSESKRRERG